MDLVSIIIPTLHRPQLLCRAVSSCFAQTWPAIEVIVVIDGPDSATDEALEAIADPRLTVLRQPRSLGPGVARNAGAGVAGGVWLAFLDDDDEWLPEKLVRQLEGLSPDQRIIASCRCRVETPGAVYVWPRRLPAPNQPVDAYLFGRRSLQRGESYLATPTLVLPAWLFRRCGFGETRQYEDTTLLLRATVRERATLIVHPEELVVIHTEEARHSLGSDFPWEEGARWLDSARDMFTAHGYSGFCLVTLGSQAARTLCWRAVPKLLARAFRHGAPTITQLLLFAAFWLVPGGGRRRLRARMAKLAKPSVRDAASTDAKAA